MRILMLAWEYPPHVVGGMGKHVAELVPALAAEGVEVYVVTPWLRGGLQRETLPSGAHIIRVPTPPMEDYEFVSFVMQVDREMELAARTLHSEVGGFDLIHTHDWLGASVGVGLKQQWRVPLLATIHATERGRGRGQLLSTHAERINSLEWWLTYEAWRVVICSQFMAHELTNYFHIPVDKIDVIPNGVTISPSPFADEDERIAFRRRFADDDESLVYFVGRVVYEKGLSVLMDAWPKVVAQQRARLIVAGTGSYLDTLRHQALELNLETRILFTGFISDADRDRLYHVADVATFPSLYEPFGIVAVEAMAARCPVVVAATGGLAEVVRSRETGIVVEADNADALARGIVYTLQHPNLAAARTEAAFKEVQEQYNWQRIARRTTAVYRRIREEWLASDWGKELMTR